MKNKYTIKIISHDGEMPAMSARDVFHSPELFYVLQLTPRHTPYMVVTENTEGSVVAHMLTSVRRRGSWLPPYLYAQARIYGEGEYEDGVDKVEVFGLMLDAITRKLHELHCFYIEVSDLSQKMFGYKHFKANHFFPVHWQEIHNSLHDKAPEERISEKQLRRIERAYQWGVETREANTKEEVTAFYKMLRGFYRLKLRRLIPPEHLFLELNDEENCRILITLYKGKVIGGTCCVFSQGDAYLWYLASKRKSYPHLHPNLMSIWYAIKFAHAHGYRHIFFMDVGLPFKQNPFREFILSFGGKPIGTYRWFLFSNRWLNSLLSWFYRG